MPEPVVHADVVCPFCALLCEDLVVEAEGRDLRVAARGCARAAAAFAHPVGDAAPRVAGEPVALEAAIARAAELVRASRLPLVAGLGTDTDGVRAALALAEARGGIVDHAGAEALMANLDAMRATGWYTGTLAEVRNRADLVLLIGTDALDLAPRFFERCVWPGQAIDAEALARRRVVYLGGEDPDTAPGTRPDGEPARHLPCPPDRLLEVVGILRALVAGRRVRAAVAGGIATDRLRELAAELRAARYPVVVWASGALPANRADLLATMLAELTQELNVRGRCIGLPLAGPGNPIGANQVCAWQSGLPLRTSFAGGVPAHDPHDLAAGRLLAAGAVDLLLWVATFATTPPPATDLPTVALVRLGTAFDRVPEVAIPVGTPGLDQDGTLYRTDSVVALPVRRLREAGLPSSAAVLDAIAARLRS